MKADLELNLLFDLLASRPTGVPISEIADHLHVSSRQAHKRIQQMRLMFGEDSDINVVYEIRGKTYYFKLVGNFTDSKEYLLIRLGDCESRLQTIHAVAKSAVRGFEPEPFRGMQAKAFELSLRQSRESLSLLVSSGSGLS